MPKAHVIGSCFDTYILAEDESGLILIDKHAAHERILFNQLRKQVDIPTQMLLQPVVVDLSGEEYAAMMDGMEQIQSHWLCHGAVWSAQCCRARSTGVH